MGKKNNCELCCAGRATMCDACTISFTRNRTAVAADVAFELGVMAATNDMLIGVDDEPRIKAILRHASTIDPTDAEPVERLFEAVEACYKELTDCGHFEPYKEAVKPEHFTSQVLMIKEPLTVHPAPEAWMHVSADGDKYFHESEKDAIDALEHTSRLFSELYVPLYRHPTPEESSVVAQTEEIVTLRKKLEFAEERIAALQKIEHESRDKIARLAGQLADEIKSETCDKTCDKADECCNSVAVAPKGVKVEIVGLLDNVNFWHADNPLALGYVLKSTVDAIREALDQIEELPAPDGWAQQFVQEEILNKYSGLRYDLKLRIAAALVQAAKGGAK